MENLTTLNNLREGMITIDVAQSRKQTAAEWQLPEATDKTF
jgi:hypothetical protein